MSREILASEIKMDVSRSFIWGVPSVRRAACVTAIFLLAYFGNIESSLAGSGFTEKGNALTKALDEDLIAKGFCKDNKSCTAAQQMFRADGLGNHIHLSMYGQRDMLLASAITAFLVAHGLEITGGMPITLYVFSGPHEQYAGLKRIFGVRGQSIKLEINK